MKIKITINNVLLCLVLVVFICPDGLKYYESLDGLFKIFSVARYIISFIYIFKTLKKYYLRKYIWKKETKVVLILVLLMSFALYVNKTIKLTTCLYFFTILGFWCFNAYYLYNNKDNKREKYLKICKWYIIVSLLLQVVSLVMFPAGMIVNRAGSIHLLGGKNGVSLYALLLIDILLLMQVRYRTLFFVSLLLTAVMVMNNTFSGLGAMLLITIYIGMPVINNKFTNFLKKHLLRFVLISFVLFFFIIIIGEGNNNIISIVTSLIGKDFTFSGRRAIWGAALTSIYANPLWGVGQGLQYDVWNNGKYVYSAHNTFLDIGVSYGLICLLVFTILIILIIRNNFGRKIKNNISMVVLLSLILVMMFEAVELDFKLWAILCITQYDIFRHSTLKGDLHENRNSNNMV